jgi:hypothetical protein
MPQDSPLLMRPKEVAKALNLSEQRLAAMRLEGNGPVFCKLGVSVFYSPNDIGAWLAQARRRSTSEQSPAA